MAVSVMASNSWRTGTSFSVMTSGAWRAAKAAWVMASGTWQQIWTSPLASPSSLSVSDTTACVSGTPSYKAHLTWTNGDASLQVRVYDGTTLVTTLSSGTTSYDHTGLTHHSAHSYTVKHYDGSTESPSSNSAAVTIGSNPCLSTPTITATDRSTCSGGTAAYSVRITVTSSLTWGHRIYRDGTLVGTMIGSASTFDDTPPGIGNYSYTATEYDNPDESSASTAADISISNPCTPAAVPPTSITVTDTGFCDGGGSPVFQADVSFTPGNINLQHRVYLDGVLYDTLAVGITDTTVVASSAGNHVFAVSGYNGTDESSTVSTTTFLANYC